MIFKWIVVIFKPYSAIKCLSMIRFLYPQLNFSENTTQSIKIHSIYTLFRMKHKRIKLVETNIGTRWRV